MATANDNNRPSHARRLIGVAAIIGIAVAGVVIARLSGCAGGAAGPPDREIVMIGGERFELELAIDEASRTTGLMRRESIEAHGGMLFVFPSSQLRSFWMGYCLTDMDILFLDGRGHVTAAHQMVVEAPRREGESEAAYATRLRDYWSNFPAQFAIELKAGTLERLGVKIQDRIELDLQRLKKLAR